MALDPDSEIKNQDRMLVLKEVAFNPVGTELVFDLLKANWTYVETQ